MLLSVHPGLYVLESFADDCWFRGGDIVAIGEGLGQKIFVDNFANLIVHQRTTKDELRANVPHSGLHLHRHAGRQKLKDEQGKLQAHAAAQGKGFERDRLAGRGDEFVAVAGVNYIETGLG